MRERLRSWLGGRWRFGAAVGIAVRMMFRADPRSSAAALACSMVMAFLPSATLVVQRALVNRVSEAGTTAVVGVGLVVAVVAFALFVVAEDAVDLILSTCTDNVRDRVEVLVSGALIEHVNDFHTLELFESSRLLDGLGLAKAGVAGFGRLCWAVFGVAHGWSAWYPLWCCCGRCSRGSRS